MIKDGQRGDQGDGARLTDRPTVQMNASLLMRHKTKETAKW